MSSNVPALYDHYIPERNYISRNYKPFGKPFDDMCGHCEMYYSGLFEKGMTDRPFPPNCKKHIAEPLKHLIPSDFDTEEEYSKAIVSLDPISWAVMQFGWEARWYQEEMLSCTAKYKVMRCGRRVGKTEGACIALLHHATTHNNRALLVLAPYEAQVSNIFQMLSRLIESSQNLNQSVSRKTLNPHRIQFANGSYILGFSAGSKTAARSDKVRGQDAHVIYIDEFDYIPDSDIAAVSAILISHPDCQLWTTSTPTGEHKRFFAICTDKNLGYKEFWFTSTEIPHWSDDMEKEMRREYSAEKQDSPEWQHEVLAEFGDQIMGVFRNSMVDKAMSDYDLGKASPSHEGTYILGVDWNKTSGTHMVIMEWDGRFVLLDKIIIPRGDFTQILAVDKIIELHQRWNFKGIYVDRGYGSTQVEMLKKHGLQNPSSNMQFRLRDFAMQEMIVVRDPTNGAEIKKHTKPFMVNALSMMLDGGMLVLPTSEDTRVVRDNMAMGVVQQMRNFKIEGYSVHGLPKYSQGEEHTLTALMLAVGGFQLLHSDLTKVSLSGGIGIVPSFGQTQENFYSQDIQHSEILKNVQRDAESRNLDAGVPFFGFEQVNGGTVRDQQKFRKNFSSGGRSRGEYTRGNLGKSNQGNKFGQSNKRRNV